MAIEMIREDSGSDAPQVFFSSGPGKADVPDVVVEVEVWIVDPDRAVFDRDPQQFLTVAGDPVQYAFITGADLPDVDSTLLRLQGSGFEDLDPRYVHRSRRCLREQEGVVHRGEYSCLRPPPF
jgi:hypothetical protein